MRQREFPSITLVNRAFTGRLVGLLSSVLFLYSCSGSELDKPAKHTQVEAKAPVMLPAKPNLDSILKAPRMFPDGTMTVTGLVLDKAKHLGSKVQVKGVIRELAPDCPFLTDPKAKENRPRPGEKRRVCKSLYLTMADSMIAPKSLLIVNYNPYLHPHLKAGMELSVTGHYDTKGVGFVRPRDGLIVVDDVLNYAVDNEGVLYTDPAEIARVKAELAADPKQGNR
ncbi:MAG: hypothetical protein RBU37_09905 [Myxococcota bacterium]|jgi:hypothetical protein|nr:hypothetical protein [Myxococcota bacterium]